MNFTEFFSLHPFIGTAFLIVVSVWAFEVFLMPFKINIYVNTSKRIETILRQILGRIEANKSIDMDYKQIMSLMKIALEKEKKES